MTNAELLALLDESQQLLETANQIEQLRVPAVSDEELKHAFSAYSAALALVEELDQLRMDATEPVPEPSVGLQEALVNCAQATQDGYRRAMQYLDDSGKVIQQAQGSITRISRTAGSDQANAPILEKLNQSITNLKTEHDRQRKLAEDKSQQLETFNITLFGRTGAGKSTLMEILTEGDGKSIGKGAQRTTQDVRPYQWRGLTVTDVPGIAAFGGENDEELAHEAAEKADLVVFLITDNGAQPEEAKHLARLRQQGHPLLGICNVNQGLNSNAAIRRFIRDQDTRFDQVKLGQISRQFDEMADQYTPGRELPLTAVHLLAKFKADHMENSELRTQLEKASRFRQVEERILDEVITNGTFLRVRSFLGSAAVSALETSEGTLEIANHFDRLYDRIRSHAQGLRSYPQEFQRSANQQFQQIRQQTTGQLRDQIPTFANAHCEDKNASQAWQSLVRSIGIEAKFRSMSQRLASECEARLREIVKEIQDEINILSVNISSASISGNPIGNSKKAWGWATTISTSILGGAAVGATLFATPVPFLNLILGAAGVVVGAIGGLISLLKGGRGKKRREAIGKMTTQLRNDVDSMESKMRSTFEEWLNRHIISGSIEKAIKHLDSMSRIVKSTATATRKTAQRQRDSLLGINRETIELAMRHLGHPRTISRIAKVARIPGQSMVLTTTGSSRLPKAVLNDLEALFNESVAHIPDDLNVRQVIETLTKGYRRSAVISIDHTARTARIQLHPDDRQGPVQMRLASQLTGYYISNQTGG